MLHRREILKRDVVVNWRQIFNEIRAFYNSADICFILNICRSDLSKWERGVHIPNFENGRAVLKLLKYCKDVANSQPKT